MSSVQKEIESLAEIAGKLRTNLQSVVRGKDEAIESVLAGVFAGGSILVEDVPGVGKTTLAKTLAASVAGEYQRVQCTPDLLPADVLGFSIFRPNEGVFEFQKGPIFCNVLLVDEINRASPRTQSALLEAMAEQQVTIEGVRYRLPQPLIVIATQNPAGSHGTFMLPESQLDRFAVQFSMDYPDEQSELEILYSQSSEKTIAAIENAVSLQEIIACQEFVESIHVEEQLGKYILQLVAQTRTDARLKLGCSPRGSQMLFRVSQAHAFLQGRDFVLPDDIQQCAVAVLAHRVTAASTASNSTAVRREIIGDILERVQVPS